MYQKTTDGISVKVEPMYLEDQSSPEEGRFFWAYRVVIENQTAEVIRLLSRYWRITDSTGITQEVAGEGVVGNQPVLNPGESYEYMSGAPLPTPGGFMVGNYTMEKPGGKNFTVDIPPFSLDSPHQKSAIH